MIIITILKVQLKLAAMRFGVAQVHSSEVRTLRSAAEDSCSGGLAVRADPKEVDPVLGDLKALFISDRSGGLTQCPLQPLGGVNILDLAAGLTHQMMVVVTGDIFAQFEAAVVVGACHSANNPSLDQGGDIPISSALR